MGSFVLPGRHVFLPLLSIRSPVPADSGKATTEKRRFFDAVKYGRRVKNGIVGKTSIRDIPVIETHVLKNTDHEIPRFT